EEQARAVANDPPVQGLVRDAYADLDVAPAIEVDDGCDLPEVTRGARQGARPALETAREHDSVEHRARMLVELRYSTAEHAEDPHKPRSTEVSGDLVEQVRT